MHKLNWKSLGSVIISLWPLSNVMPFDSLAPTSEVVSRNNALIDDFVKRYETSGEVIEVNFRGLVPEIRGYERVTHLIHTYPAKLISQIPYLFINNTRLSSPGDTVLDPFCGSGTVPLESILAGRQGLGCDANPLARLITSVKTTPLAEHKVRIALDTITAKVPRMRSRQTPEVVNRDYWFPERTSWVLGRILTCIEAVEEKPIREFLLVCFSNCVKKVSFADPNVSVPVKLNPKRYRENSKRYKRVERLIAERNDCNILEKFVDQVNLNLSRLKNLKLTKRVKAKVISTDATALTCSLESDSPLPSGSVKLIVTSPPYAGAQKYIRASSLSLGWTRMTTVSEFPALDRKIIGRESFRKGELELAATQIAEADELIKTVAKVRPARAAVIFSYLIEMREALREMVRVLAPQGHLVLVIGNNRICGREFDAQRFLTQYLLDEGLSLKFKLIDDIRSYGLMTKRNKTADIISREWVLVFQKSND